MTAFAQFDDGSPLFLSALQRIIEEIGADRSIRQSLDIALDTLINMLGYKRVYLDLFDLPMRNSKMSITKGGENSFQHLYAPGPLVTGQVVATKRRLIIENINDHPDFYGRPPAELDSLSFLCVPVMSAPVIGRSNLPASDQEQGRTVLGTLSLDIPKAPLIFLETHCRFLEVLAALFGNTVPKLAEELVKPMKKRPEPSIPTPLDDVVPTNVLAVSKSMRLVMRQISQTALNDTPVLLRGEEGTGREFLAESLHKQSNRRDKPFLKVQFLTEPEEHLERKLFGIQKGGPSQHTQSKRSVFELAQGGIVYLDGIEEMSLSCQQELLRVLQEGAVQRIDADSPIPVDVRVVASTASSLEDMMATGTFLEDLYYSLSVYPIYVPSLRDRSSDILPLAESFLQEFAKAQGKTIKRISTPAIDLLHQYHWPDNVSELRSCIDRAVANCDEGVIRAYHLPPTLQTAESSGTEPMLSFGEAVAKFEEELLVEALKKASGNMFQAAKNLHESYRVVNYKVKKHGLDPKRFSGHKKR
ncbi:sigma 54-interacting transcriptional regulator [Desulfovibrio inopinatus]|uniref:sigma 54-interacting transcriptional regulator n=1 Tax=Desulfovibrio inopinatus TaxID=102109 RepID=UPI00040CEF49|nr:sigma 54-interacting transcriptional regulator [Desulfovibrio inopinatus]